MDWPVSPWLPGPCIPGGDQWEMAISGHRGSQVVKRAQIAQIAQMTQITTNDPNHPKSPKMTKITPNGSIWPYPSNMAVYGRIWPYMAVYGRIWPYMAVYGRIWPYLTIFDPYLGHFGPFCLMSLLERVIFDPPWGGPLGGSQGSKYGHIWVLFWVTFEPFWPFPALNQHKT